MGACERVWCTGESKSMSSFPFTWTAGVKVKLVIDLPLPTIAEVKVRSIVALPAPGMTHATLQKSEEGCFAPIKHVERKYGSV